MSSHWDLHALRRGNCPSRNTLFFTIDFFFVPLLSLHLLISSLTLSLSLSLLCYPIALLTHPTDVRSLDAFFACSRLAIHCSQPIAILLLSALLSIATATLYALNLCPTLFYLSSPLRIIAKPRSRYLMMYKHLNVVHTLLHRNEELEVQTLIVT